MEEKHLFYRQQDKKSPEGTPATSMSKEVFFSRDPRDLDMVAKSVPCQEACPALTNVPGYIRCIYEKRYGRAYELNRISNVLPGVLGRVCSRPCELKCRHGETGLGEPVGICYLKRASYDLKSPLHRIKESLYNPSGKKVAIVGAGPAGLGAAYELATLGHGVKIFEAMAKPGGMLMYGIPDFRLPRDVLNLEIQNILRLGVEISYGVEVGVDLSLEYMLKEFDAVLIATGCTIPNDIGVPGADLEGVYNGLDFMYQANTGTPLHIGEKVVIIGKGFTAMDCARTARRLGASDVTVNMRMTEEYMPVDEQEKHEVKFENIKFYSLVATRRILGENGRVTGVEFLRNGLEYTPKPPGRKAVPIKGSEFVVPADAVIIAIGQHPAPSRISKKIQAMGENIRTKPDSHRTNIEGLFAAGDCVSGSSYVISAIADGRFCAQEIDRFLTGVTRKVKVVRMEPVETTDRERSYDFIPKTEIPTIGLNERMADGNREVETGYDEKLAQTESIRCYLCNLKYEIDTSACIYCSACIDVAPRDCIKMIEKIEINPDGTYGKMVETSDWSRVVAIAIDNERCIRCGNCYEVCPVDCIRIIKTELIEHGMEE